MLTYDEVVKKYNPKLKAIAYKLSKYNFKLDQDDLYQEELVYLWESFKENKLEGNTDSFILQGCYFHLRNYMRKVVEVKDTFSLDQPANENGDNLMKVLNLHDNATDNYHDSLDTKLLSEVIYNNGLSLKEKALLPYLSEGLTLREIGNRLGVSHVYVIKMKESIRIKCLKYLDKI